MRKFAIVLVWIAAPLLICAQGSASLQRITVTSVTLRLDSLNTVEEVATIRQALQAHPEIKDMDVKFTNANFTMEDNLPGKLDQIVQELKVYQPHVSIYSARGNETFTRVPEESCDSRKKSVPDMSESEVKQKGITRNSGQ